MNGYSDKWAPTGCDCWAEVDLDAVCHNARMIRQHLQEKTKLMAVLKANAYGLGAVPVAQALAQEKLADMLAVTTPEEGVALRQAGIDLPILVFLPASRRNASTLRQYQLTATVDSIASAEALAEAGKTAHPCHIKLNTGMNRLGAKGKIAYDLPVHIARDKRLQLEGIYTHFYKAASRLPYTCQDQVKELTTVVETVQKFLPVGMIHVCNSAATVRFPQYHFNMVRCGTLLFGQSPVPLPAGWELRDPWSVRCRIIQEQIVGRGQHVGYGGDYRADHPRRVGILPIGYHDGFGLEPPARNNFWGICAQFMSRLARLCTRHPLHYAYAYDGKLPLIGRVSMQMTTIDISRKPLEVGDTVGITLRRVCASQELPRIYLAGGEPVAGDLNRTSES